MTSADNVIAQLNKWRQGGAPGLEDAFKIGALWLLLRYAKPDAMFTMRQREGGTIEVYAQDPAAHQSLGYAYAPTEAQALEKLLDKLTLEAVS